MKFRRYTLKPKESKAILKQAASTLGLNLEALIEPKSSFEVVEAEFGKVFLLDGSPAFFEMESEVLPMLLFSRVVAMLPKIVVDMGAVPHVCNGANVMVPGIVKVEGDFKKDAVVLVVDEKYGKPIALGKSLYDAAELRTLKKGIALRNLHYVGDVAWDSAKTMAR